VSLALDSEASIISYSFVELSRTVPPKSVKPGICISLLYSRYLLLAEVLLRLTKQMIKIMTISPIAIPIAIPMVFLLEPDPLVGAFVG